MVAVVAVATMTAEVVTVTVEVVTVTAEVVTVETGDDSDGSGGRGDSDL
jgi:hypothetical protein